MNKSERSFDSLSFTEKKTMIEHLIVIHPQMQAILNKIDYCREHAKLALESVSLLIMGDRGSGKTTIKNTFLEKNAAKRTKTSTFIPALHITIPVPATVGGLNTCLLTALKDPFPNHGSLTAQTLRVYNLVEKCRVEIGMFDEFQHFAERESFKMNRTVSDWAKNFMNETRKPLVLFGTPKSTEILDGKENEQFKRRVPFRILLKPFGWSIEDERDIFRKFLQKVDEMLPLAEFSNLADPDLAARIHFATAGNMNEIMRLIRAAAILALKRELPKIDLGLLRESFEDNLAANAPHLENPFRQ